MNKFSPKEIIKTVSLVFVTVFVILSINDYRDRREQERIDFIEQNYQGIIDDLEESLQKEMNLNNDKYITETYRVDIEDIMLVNKCIDNYIDTFFKAYDHKSHYSYDYKSMVTIDDKIYFLYEFIVKAPISEEEPFEERYILLASKDFPQVNIQLYQFIPVF